MSEDSVIFVDNVTKAYRIWDSPAARLVSPLQAGVAGMLPVHSGVTRWLGRRATSAYRDFYALSDVSFSVQRGESVGIIGRNGSGKSTLLQVIAGTLQPTSGSTKVKGRIAALLELGAGFNPEFTGRENVFLSGAVLGLGRAEIEARFGEITTFADIGNFIEQPVKTYSSGMMMRLAFAVSTCVDPDILIVDEALSVGDAPFQAKCYRRLRQLIEKGVSLLFVSHDIGTVRSICSRALWLKDGKAEMWGEAKQVAKEYEKFCWREQGVVLENDPKIETQPSVPVAPATSGDIHPAHPGAEVLRTLTNECLAKCENRYGTGQSTIIQFAFLDKNNSPLRTLEFGQSVRACCLVNSLNGFSGKMRLGMRIKNLKGDFLMSVSDLRSSPKVDLSVNDQALFSVEFPAQLAHGEYLVHVAIFEIKTLAPERPEEYSFAESTIHDCAEEAWLFTVLPHKPIAAVGPVHFHSTLRVERL